MRKLRKNHPVFLEEHRLPKGHALPTGLTAGLRGGLPELPGPLVPRSRSHLWTWRPGLGDVWTWMDKGLIGQDSFRWAKDSLVPLQESKKIQSPVHRLLVSWESKQGNSVG